jgi:hypothetical protein
VVVPAQVDPASFHSLLSVSASCSIDACALLPSKNQTAFRNASRDILIALNPPVVWGICKLPKHPREPGA